MKRKLLIFLAMLLAGLYTPETQAQEKLTMEQAVMGLYTDFATTRLSGFSWLPDGHHFSYYSSEKPEELIIYNAKSNTVVRRISTKEIMEELTAPQLSHQKWVSDKEFVFSNSGKVYNYNIDNRKLKTLSEIEASTANFELAPDGSFAVYTVDNSLAISESNGTKNKKLIAESKTNDIVYGQTVSRSEYGITKGIFISPKSNYIAYYKKDQSQVQDYPILQWHVDPLANENIKYPMAGGASETITLFVYNVKKEESIEIQADNKDNAYLTCISWSPDEKYVFLQHLNRATTESKLQKFDARTGQFVKTLHTQKSDKYVEPQHPITFINKTDFILQSDESGYNHLYLYTERTGKLEQVTSGNWQVNNFLGYNEEDNTFLYTGSKEDPREEHIYFTKKGKSNSYRIDKHAGWHYASISPNGQYILDHFSSATVPSQYDLITTHTEKSTTLLANRNPLLNIETSNIEEVTIMADDGTPLYGRILKGKDFDRTKKYPVIVYLYNGPHVQLVKNRFPASGNLWYDYLTSRGYVVFVMDGRGSSNRGRDFEQATYRQLGKVELADQMKGIQFLKMQHYVDADRMGIHGWSFGGYMTTNFMLNAPDAFKVGVAGGPVLDWEMYEVMYTERYMDTPEENPEGYASTKLLGKAENLKGKLLMIHGAEDDVVVWQHSMKFIQECVDKNVAIDYFVYPNAHHNVRGKNRVHLMQKITDYFDLHLKNEL